MPSLAKNLSRSLANSLAKAMDGSGVGIPILKFDGPTFSFTNASPRYLSYGGFTDEFAGGVPAIYTNPNNKKFLLVEEAETAEQTYSQQLDNGAWTKTYVTVTADNIADPAGDTTAEKINETADNAGHIINCSAVSADGSSEYLVSCYYKAGNRFKGRLSLPAGPFVGNPKIDFNLNTGEVYANADVNDYGIVDAGNGWYKLWLTATSDAAVAFGPYMRILDDDGNATYLGDVSKYLYMWQPMVCKSGADKSTIETVASGVTKAKDQPWWTAIGSQIVTKLNDGFRIILIPQWKSTYAGTIYAFTIRTDASNYCALQYYTSGDTFRVRVNTGGGASTAVTSGVVAFSAYSVITIDLYPKTGKMVVSGCDSGNGTFTGTPFDDSIISTHLFYVGMVASASYWNGLVSEPETV